MFYTALLHSLEKDATPLTSQPRNHAAITDWNHWNGSGTKMQTNWENLQTNGFRHVGIDPFHN